MRLRKAAEKRLDLISFGAESPEAVDALAQKLAGQGVQIASEPDKLQTAGGGYGFRFFDIDGRTVEISADVETRGVPRDRGEGGHPGPALPRGDEHQRPEPHPRLLRQTSSASSSPTRSGASTWAR
ncbi:MAG: hypothetical protein QM747_00635 [Nocardioides sp.]